MYVEYISGLYCINIVMHIILIVVSFTVVCCIVLYYHMHIPVCIVLCGIVYNCSVCVVEQLKHRVEQMELALELIMKANGGNRKCTLIRAFCGHISLCTQKLPYTQ